jgi:predicted amidophosphoribosyltransferase
MDLRDLFFPRSCLSCRKSGRYLCEQCIDQVPKSRELCPYCNSYSYQGKTHPSCQKQFGIDGHNAAWKYEGLVRKGIHAFKYRFASDIAEEFVTQVDVELLSEFNDAILIPIPLHKVRENWRGFNQSSLIAAKLVKKFNIPCIETALIRIENTTPQAQLRDNYFSGRCLDNRINYERSRQSSQKSWSKGSVGIYLG